MILAIKTDQSDSTLAILDSGKVSQQITWHSGKKLSEEIFLKIEGLLDKANIDKQDLKGIIIFEGPGSFTGLRIGFSVANALAYSLNIGVAAEGGEDWMEKAKDQLSDRFTGSVAPNYGGEANITQPRK